jgi:hypothetical protein
LPTTLDGRFGQTLPIGVSIEFAMTPVVVRAAVEMGVLPFAVCPEEQTVQVTRPAFAFGPKAEAKLILKTISCYLNARLEQYQ